MASDSNNNNPGHDTGAMTRRGFLRRCAGGAALAALGGVGAAIVAKGRGAAGQAGGMVWQIDPHKCTQCGKCATYCVMKPSAVKCVHAFALCGYCNLCTGYFEPASNALNTGAENQLCPTGAIRRNFVEDPYYQYTIDEPLCVGCAKCVKGCGAFGNGSLFLQIRHDRCVNCNECSIVAACPSDAVRRVPAAHPYLLKDKDQKA